MLANFCNCLFNQFLASVWKPQRKQINNFLSAVHLLYWHKDLKVECWTRAAHYADVACTAMSQGDKVC